VPAPLKISKEERSLKHRPEFALDARRMPAPRSAPINDRAHDCWFVRYIPPVAFEAVLQEALEMPAEERTELVERLIDSLDDNEVELSAEELAELDDALVDADGAAARAELIPHDEVLAQMRQIL
jgi:putative addiction module component (TIGR02574 family)